MNRYQRRLPHWDVIGQPLFVTFRLHGSLPQGRAFPPGLTAGHAFVALDRLLDVSTHGPTFLRRPEIASLVVQSLRDGQNRFRRYQLHAFVVMPNHVHLLATGAVPLHEWLRSLKGFTGHEANRLLSLKGAFWQEESYDHLLRKPDEFERIKRYIELNPVKAGLAATPQEYPWSSAAP
jgi:REP element-mobilizing transposase RayT